MTVVFQIIIGGLLFLFGLFTGWKMKGVSKMTSQKIIEEEKSRDIFAEQLKELYRFSRTAQWKEALHAFLKNMWYNDRLLNLIAEWRGCDKSDIQISDSGRLFIRGRVVSDNAYASLSRWLDTRGGDFENEEEVTLVMNKNDFPKRPEYLRRVKLYKVVSVSHDQGSRVPTEEIKERKEIAYFHVFCANGCHPLAIVELEDGHIEYIRCDLIRFEE